MADITIYFTDWWSTFWAAVEAIATVILIVGIYLTIRHIKETRKSTNAQITIGLFQELRNDKALKIFRYIYSLEHDENAKNITQIHQDDISYVIERFDMLALLVINGIVDEKLAIEAFCGVTALKCWYQLCHYIREERKNRGIQWARYYEDFARHSLEYLKKDFPDNWVLYYKKSGDVPIDLVKLLASDKSLCPKYIKEK